MDSISTAPAENQETPSAGGSESNPLSHAEYVQELIQQQRQRWQELPHRPMPDMTLAEALADLKGTVEGPGDLSYNTKYLEGFGK